jgi:hypothetical protein
MVFLLELSEIWDEAGSRLMIAREWGILSAVKWMVPLIKSIQRIGESMED